MLTEDERNYSKCATYVTREDRDAAMRFLQRVAMMNWVILRRIIHAMEEGRPDEYGLSYILADHRLSTERKARIEGVRLGLESAAQLIRMIAGSGAYNSAYQKSLPDIDDLLGTLSPEELIANGGVTAILSGGDRHRVRFA